MNKTQSTNVALKYFPFVFTNRKSKCSKTIIQVIIYYDVIMKSALNDTHKKENLGRDKNIRKNF